MSRLDSVNDELDRNDCEVLSLLSTGMTDDEIAERLHTTSADVESRVAAILAHLGLDGRAELILVAALGRLPGA